MRIAALIAYLVSWSGFALAALLGAFRRNSPRIAAQITVREICATLLQAAAFAAITLSLPAGPLRPRPLESFGALALAPLAFLLFIWTQQFSAPRDRSSHTLVTTGAYRWLRHPMYLAFLLMLLATALLASSGIKTIAAIVLYLTGSEIRIASEEADLLARFPEEYPAYQRRTKWRYVPGLR